MLGGTEPSWAPAPALASATREPGPYDVSRQSGWQGPVTRRARTGCRRYP